MKRALVFIGLASTLSLQAQQGGSQSYAFLNLESSARVAATGGSLLSIQDDDPNTAFINPSLLDTNMHGALALNYINYFAGINYLYAGYVHSFKDITASANLMYLNYGKFTRTDDLGNVTGEFTANDMVLSVGASKRIDSAFSLGANVKIINSVLESYTSFGAAVDLSGTYRNLGKNFSASILMRNVGMQFSTYTDDNRQPLPFGIDLGFSKRAAKAPFILHVLLKDLQRWDLTYTDPNAEPELDFNGDTVAVKAPGFLNKFMRHVNLGLEFSPSQAFFIDFGFNYRRRQELKLDNRPGLVGFSIGTGIKIKRFRFSYGRSSYHRAGGSNHITITTNILKSKPKKNT